MIKPWRVLSSRRIVWDQWLRLRADRCQRDDGMLIDPFYVLEAEDWVCILPLTADNRVLLVREYRHGAAAVVLSLPGGGIDAHDGTATDAAIRELREETGYVASRMVPLGATHSSWARQTNKVHFFLALDVEKVAPPELDANEQIETVLMPFAEAGAVLAEGTSHNAAGLWLARRHLHERGLLV